jgi:hypothetical protein
MKNPLATVVNQFRAGDRYIGQFEDQNFDTWLIDKKKQYKGKTVVVTIEISPQQNVKVIQSRKEFKELVFA